MTARLLVRHDGAVVERPPEELSDLQGRLCWLDVADPGNEDFHRIAKELALHPLALEDARKRHQRPKVDQYEGHYFIVFYAVDGGPDGEARFHEVSVFIIGHALVTVHEGGVAALAEVEVRFREGRIGTVGQLLHGLLDAMVDGYFPLVDAIGDRLDELEETVIVASGAPQSRPALRELFQIKRRMLALRQRVAPEREVLAVLARGDLGLFEREIIVYFQDVYDHIVRVTDEIDIFREIASNVIDAHLAAVSNRLNEVMKVVTSLATVLLVVSVVTGFFGMNFTGLPFDSAVAMWGAIGGMVAASIALTGLFRARGWL